MLLYRFFVTSVLALPSLALANSGLPSPGPVCDGPTLEPQTIANLISGIEKTRFQYPVRGAGYKVAPATYGKSERRCAETTDGVQCDGWQESQLSEPESLGFYLDVVDGLYTPGIYSYSQGTTRLTHYNFPTRTVYGFAALEARTIAQLELFITRPYEYYFSVDGAGHASNSRSGESFQGTVRNACAKFWSIKRQNFIDFGSDLKTWNEVGVFYYSTY